MTEVFREQPLALPGSAKYEYSQKIKLKKQTKKLKKANKIVIKDIYKLILYCEEITLRP